MNNLEEKYMELLCENTKMKVVFDYLYQVYLKDKGKSYANSDIILALKLAGYDVKEESTDE